MNVRNHRPGWSPGVLTTFQLIYVITWTALLLYVTADPLVTKQNRECRHTEFKCHSGRCIPISWRCDQDTDCEDGDDETDCSGVQGKCRDDEYRCQPADPPKTVKNGTTPSYLFQLSRPGALFSNVCIPKRWKCDGEFDCPKKDDEIGCDDIKCQEGQHQCPSYQGKLPSCIPQSWVCDGQSDCFDMSDEKDCPLTTSKCDNASEFRCADGKKCIFSNWKCDGDFDCDDGSDEQNCKANETCNPVDHFMCKTVAFCVPHMWRCDGEADCADQSDELDCDHVKPTRNTTCHPNEFKCHSGTQCISERWVCDGDDDCVDHSDEKDCKHKCTATEKPCKNGVCLATTKFCDGADDCLDGSDEENCTLPSPPPNFQNYICDSATQHTCDSTPLRCIKYANLCANNQSVNDCPNSVCSRQIKVCENTDPACTCRATHKNGLVCYCQSGYELKNGRCIDINECDQLGNCDQLCTNLPGSFKCDCYPGYKLYVPLHTDDERPSFPTKCRAVGDDPLLLLSNRATIRRYDLITNKYHPLVQNLESAVAMDFWHEKQALIWSDVSKEKIMMCHVDDKMFFGTGEVDDCLSRSNITLVSDHILTPDGLAVDWVHGLLFWTDTGLDQISVMDLETKHRRVIVSKGLDEPRAIAVDPSSGLIFWTDWGNNARIERAGMNGEDRREILSGTTVRWPNGLAVDILEKRIYWADAKVKMISSSDYYGNNVRTVLHSHEHLRHPFSLTVFEERLYWTDWDKEGVLTVNKFRGNDVTVLLRGISGPMTVRVYHQQAQPSRPNKCEGHSCSQLCLPRAHISGESVQKEKGLGHGLPYACACALGFQLHPENNRECVAVEATLEQLAGAATGRFSMAFMALVLIVALVAVAGYVWRGRKPRHFSALQFDNPIYRHAIDFGHNDNSLGAIPASAGQGASIQPRLVIGSVSEPLNTENLNARADFYHPSNYGYDLPPDTAEVRVSNVNETVEDLNGRL